MDSRRMKELTRAEEWFIIETFARLKKDSPEQKRFMEEYNSVQSKDKLGIFNIEFNINGIEFSFFETLEELFKQFDRMVEDKAKEIIKEEIQNISEQKSKFNALCDSFKRKLCEDLKLDYYEICED